MKIIMETSLKISKFHTWIRIRNISESYELSNSLLKLKF